MIAMLDRSGFDQGVIMSTAFGVTRGASPDDVQEIAGDLRARNQYTADQIAKYPDRLIAFFSVDPLHSSALPEIEHWSRTGGFAGIKMQLSSADADFNNPAHLAAIRRVVEAAYRHDLALMIHLRSQNEWGAAEVERFIAEVLPSEAKVPVQIAHLGGWGSGYDPGTQAALETFAKHIRNGNPRTRLIQFDTSAAIRRDLTEEQGAALAATMRSIGLDRFLFASDFWPGRPPDYAWSDVTNKLPLTDEEFVFLRHNRAYYLLPRPADSQAP